MMHIGLFCQMSFKSLKSLETAFSDFSSCLWELHSVESLDSASTVAYRTRGRSNWDEDEPAAGPTHAHWTIQTVNEQTRDNASSEVRT
jgi:hypothetical protein